MRPAGGGRWTIAFGPPGATPARETNLFQVVERPRRLVYASTMAMPDGSSIATGMEVTFEKEQGRTRMRIVQRGFPAAEVRDEFAGGWGSILDGLGRAVAVRIAGAIDQPRHHRQAGRRAWVGLAVIAVPYLLQAMDLTVLKLAVPHCSAALTTSLLGPLVGWRLLPDRQEEQCPNRATPTTPTALPHPAHRPSASTP